MPLNIGMMTFILASMYSFFGYPVEIAAVNALQSNASQGALLAAAGSVQAVVGGTVTASLFSSSFVGGAAGLLGKKIRNKHKIYFIFM